MFRQLVKSISRWPSAISMARAVFRLRCASREIVPVYSTAIPRKTSKRATTLITTTRVLPWTERFGIFMLLGQGKSGTIVHLRIQKRRRGQVAAVTGFRIASGQLDPDIFRIRRPASVKRHVEWLRAADIFGYDCSVHPIDGRAAVALVVQMQLAF